MGRARDRDDELEDEDDPCLRSARPSRKHHQGEYEDKHRVTQQFVHGHRSRLTWKVEKSLPAIDCGTGILALEMALECARKCAP